MKFFARPVAISTLLTLLTVAGVCQPVTTPRVASPAASATQTIGISTVTVKYSRPSVKGRKIWGELVPYGLTVQQGFGLGNPAPWRAGANENTTITFSDPARVNGIPVPAGTYGFFIIVNEGNTADIILSRNNRSWGSFFYDSTENLLRAKTQVRDHPFTETLTYDFINQNKTSTELVLNWELKQFVAVIEFDVDKIVMNNAKEELRGATAFNALGYISAAKYSFENNVEVEQGEQWIDQALLFEPTNFDALRVKSRFLVRRGKAAEADSLINDGIQRGSEDEVNAYGYLLIQLGLYDKAIQLFTTLTQRFPNSANVWDSFGETYARKGDKANAIKCFKKSLSLHPPENVRANSEKYLRQLGAL